MAKDPVDQYREDLHEEFEFRLNLVQRVSNLESTLKIVVWFLGGVALAAIGALAKALSN